MGPDNRGVVLHQLGVEKGPAVRSHIYARRRTAYSPDHAWSRVMPIWPSVVFYCASDNNWGFFGQCEPGFWTCTRIFAEDESDPEDAKCGSSCVITCRLLIKYCNTAITSTRHPMLSLSLCPSRNQGIVCKCYCAGPPSTCPDACIRLPAAALTCSRLAYYFELLRRLLRRLLLHVLLPLPLLVRLLRRRLLTVAAEPAEEPAALLLLGRRDHRV